jgi:hypothetical protein
VVPTVSVAGEPGVMVVPVGCVVMVGLQTRTVMALLVVTQPLCSSSTQYCAFAVSAGVV